MESFIQTAMKYILVLPFILVSIIAKAQNVGVGTTTPVERLDVNGNINVAGTIKANGVDGQPNQVLMKNQSGVFAWGDLCNYKNRVYFDGVTTYNWIVPANVQRISVEAWGSGGGGSSYSGGGGGGYVVATFPVTPGQTILITINFGGNGGNGNTAGTAGGNTTVTVGDTILTAHGGSGGTAGSQIQTATGGSYTITNGFRDFFAIRGEAGHECENIFTDNGTNTLEIVSNGNGGNAGNTNSTGGLGAHRIVFTATPSSTVRYRLPEVGRQPGGGGGAGFSMISGVNTNNGFSGGTGAAMIHY
jgi:hypothetical protein